MQVNQAIFVPPSEVQEEEKKEEGQPIKIRCSVFFDGTLNNRTNTESRQAKSDVYKENEVKAKDNSYENDLTNVAKMEKFVDDSAGFDYTMSVYAEGPGTEDNAGDATAGYAFGTGGTGVKAKVAIGITRVIASVVKKIPDESIIGELVIDVFGFSRGAAGARFFVHEALNEEPEYVVAGRGQVITIPARPLFRRLQNDWHKITADKVEIRFVGLYDTVASYGVPHWDDGTRLLKLDSLKRAAVTKVIHLIAADEHRANFPVTNIDSASGKGKEIYLPGVHSDVGGSYLKSSNEGKSKDDGLLLSHAYSKSTLETDRKQLIAEGWYRPDEIFIEDASFVSRYLIPAAHLLPNSSAEHKLKVHRTNIGHHYDKIPLHIMADFATEKGISLKAAFKRKNKIPGILSTAESKLNAHAKGGASKVEDWFKNTKLTWLKTLRHDFFHFSSHYTLTYGIAPNKPNFEANSRIRVIHDG